VAGDGEDAARIREHTTGRGTAAREGRVLLVRDPGAAPKRPHDKPETNGSPQAWALFRPD